MSKVEGFMNDQAFGLRQVRKNKPVKVIAVAAGKGGVGKSNVSVNLAVGLSKKNNKVLLLDADLGLANVDVMLGLHARYNLSHVMDGQCHISDIILKGPENISIIPASSGTTAMTSLSSAEHAGIINAFNELMDDFDYLIIDTAAGISDTVLSFARSSQEILVVVCDEPTSLTDAYAFIKVMHRQYGWRHFHVVVNMVRQEKHGRDLFNKLFRVCDQFLDVNLDYQGCIPFDEKVHQSVKKQTPVTLAFPDSAAAKALGHLAEQVEQWPEDDAASGNTSFFIERLVASEI